MSGHSGEVNMVIKGEGKYGKGYKSGRKGKGKYGGYRSPGKAIGKGLN